MVEISIDDIAYAEELLLPPGCRFNEERIAFIRCLESLDVVACPGSGKTTALLAKLLILARKMPLSNGRGICVLTHTNVAMDNIMKKAGIASTALFRYPNFFGTIQSFVNHFLAAPWYRSEFNRPLITIDNDRFFRELGWLYNGDYSLRPWLEPRGGLRTLGSYWFNPETLLVGQTLNSPIPKLSETSPTYRKIQALRKAVLEQGVLSFNDAYAVALRYLFFVPTAVHSFSNRFCMMFFDETQDTDDHQFEVLDKVFRPEKLLVQRIGDPNQAIYHDQVQTDGFWTPRNPLFFSDSRRYGETITNLLTAVRLDDRIALQPCTSTDSFSPYMITFEEGKEQLVIAAFSLLIAELMNGQPPTGPCKAIGWIGKDGANDGKLCIPSYFPQYDNVPRTQNRRFANFVSCAAHAIQSSRTDGAKRFLEVVMLGVAQALDIVGIKDDITGRSHTAFSAQRFWKSEHERSYNQFQEQMATNFLSALNAQLTPVDLRNRIAEAMRSTWPSTPGTMEFLDSNQIDTTDIADVELVQTRNQFVTDNGLVIEVGTVHSAKGETHFATLFLETKYQKDWDARRLIEFLKGNRPVAQIKKAHHQQNLKIAHVAFSRPTHLLAFACRASSIAGHEDDLRNNGWVIRTVREFGLVNDTTS